MISYFLLSGLLLTVGMLIFSVVFKDRVSAHQAKALLCLIFILSITIPYFVPGLPNYSKMLSEGKVFYEEYTQWNVVDISDKRLLECYNKAADSKDICDCEMIQQASKVTFVYNPVYNFFIKYGYLLIGAFYTISAIMLLWAVFKLSSLIYLVRKSALKKSDYKGLKFHMLYPYLNNKLPLSAFSLKNNYIIWSPILNALKEAEQDIVISHEVSHLRNKDSWYLFVLELFKSIFWITPAYFWFINEFKKQQEFIADESAASTAGSKRQYAGLLLKLKEWQLLNSKSYSLSLSLSGSVFKKRILRLVNPKQKNISAPRFALSVLSFALLMWFAAYSALPILQSQEIKLKQYEILSESHSN
jgi:beta-lactamase regulating signal transducer with metallopeptidase domain